MALLIVVLLILGLVAFLLATFNAPVRINLVAAGLACWILTAIIGAWPK
jgi:hypothetical protein